MIVATYRADEAAMASGIASALAKVEREGAISVPLGPLERKDVLAAVRESLPPGAHLSDTRLQAILELAEGVPFVLEELLRDEIARSNHPSQHHRPVVISLRTSVLDRLADSKDSDRDTLLRAAVIGRDFNVVLLARIVDRSEREIVETVKEGGRRQLLVEVPGTSRFAFRHALTREVLYHELLAYEARSTHVRVAQALQEMAPRSDSEIAYHTWAARSPDAVEWSRRAAEQADAIGAYGDAAVYYERALELSPETEDAYLRTLQRLAFCLCTTGQIERARSICEQAAMVLRDRGMQDAAWRQMLAVAQQFFERGEAERAIEIANDVLSQIERDSTVTGLKHGAEVILALFLCQTGRAREGLAILERASSNDVKDPSDVWNEELTRGLALYALAIIGKPSPLASGPRSMRARSAAVIGRHWPRTTPGACTNRLARCERRYSASSEV